MENNLFLLNIFLIATNFTGFVLVGIDKKRSVENSDRLPEVYLFFVSIFFASLGVLFGMYFFRHKTRKIYFPVGIGLLLIQQTILIMSLLGRISL
jgi:uncharacterized membrane protein YsdA (DUF1294 family)